MTKDMLLTCPAGRPHPEGVMVVSGTLYCVNLGSGKDPLAISVHGPFIVFPIMTLQSFVPLT